MSNVGRWGEAQVANYLRDHGYRLVSSGYRCRFGEIDLIAWDGDILCFVEVKTRTNLDVALPREYVTKAKQSRLKKTALFYLADNDLDCRCRFDVAEVYADEGGEAPRIEYIEDAFM